MGGELSAEGMELSPQVVRDRIRWARRQGNPRWLWPDADVHAWQAGLAQIARAVSHVLGGQAGVATLTGEAREIGIAAYTSGTGPLLGYWLATGALQAEPRVRALLELHYRHNAERMQRLAGHASAAVTTLAGSGVEVTVLKGMHTAYSYFPDPGARPVSDIDLWVRAADLAAAGEALRSLGYRRCSASYGEETWSLPGAPVEPRTLEFVHRDDPWSIDLHWTLDRQYSSGAPLLRLDRALGRGVSAWPLSPTGKVLTGAELIVHLASHASLGLISLSLLRLFELVLVIRKLEGESPALWQEVVDVAASTGSPACIYPALRMVGETAAGTVPEEVLQGLQRQAPAAVRRVMARLTPATCQRLLRCSFEERFMWTETIAGWARELAGELIPRVPLDELGRISATRFWRLARGTVSR